MNDSNVVIEDISNDITPEPIINPSVPSIPTPPPPPEPTPQPPINPYKTSNQHFLIRNTNMRNELLKQSDYYMLVDVYEILSDIQKQEIRTYRQTLRDFININKNKYLNDGIPYIEFPTAPEWVKDIKPIKY
jgi:hypothetical protein